MPNFDFPFRYNIKAIELHKFDGSYYINMQAQVAELTIFQSIFEPFMKAEMVILDEVGLFFNFPMTGEELVKVVVESPALNDFENVEDKTLYFMIDDVRNIRIDDQGKNMTFMMGLVSVEAYVNMKRKISETFYGLVSDIVKEIHERYLITGPSDELNWINSPKDLVHCEPTLEYRNIVCPMMNPIRFITLLKKFAVPAVTYAHTTHGAKFVFYEDMEGFHFRSIENMLTDDSDGKRAEALRPNRKFVYVADKTLIDTTKASEYRSITNIRYNRRFSTTGKIVGGYFENVYAEIDLSKLKQTFTAHQHNHNEITSPKIDRWSMNSESYINDVKILENPSISNIYPNSSDTANRIFYGFNNRETTDFPSAIKNSWGQAQETSIGLSQIDLNIAVSGDSRINVGELIYCELPEIHGFTDQHTEEDYVSGYFLVSEIAHSFTIHGQHSTSMRINKNSYNNFLSITSNYTSQAKTRDRT